MEWLAHNLHIRDVWVSD